MNVRGSTLPNGMTVVTDPDAPTSSTATVGVVEAGVRATRRRRRTALSHLLEHMAFKGTKSVRPCASPRRSRRRAAISTPIWAREQTCFYARVLKDDVALGADILPTSLINPTFSADELAREEGGASEIGQSEDTPDDIIYDHLQAAAFLTSRSAARSSAPRKPSTACCASAAQASGDPLCRPVDDPHRLAMRRSRRIGAGGRKVCAHRKGDKPAAAARPLPGGDRRKAQKLEQAHLTFGVEGPSYTDEDAFAAQVFATAFGGGMSRAFQEVREKARASPIRSMPSCIFADTGFFSASRAAPARRNAEIAPVVVGQLGSDGGRRDREEEGRRARAQAKLAFHGA